jgi:hypothetical protein
MLPTMVLDDPDFSALPAPLTRLFAAAGEQSLFAQPFWYHVLARHGIDKGARPRLYTDDDRRPRAALVCYVAPGSRRLRGLSTYYSCEHGPLLDPQGSAPLDCLRRLADEIAGERPRWDTVQLGGLDPESPGFALLGEAFRAAGWSVHPYFDSGAWFEATGGLAFADYLAARPPALRNTWRRKSAKLKSDAAITIHDSSHGGDGIEEAIHAYEAVYRASWKGGEPHPEFVPALIRAAARAGALRLGILRIGGRPAAAQLWLLWGGRATIYKLAHDRAFDALSPGTVLTMAMMERILDVDRAREVDFGRGDDPYKRQWLGSRRERWGLLIANRATPHGLALSLRQGAGALVRRWRRAPAIRNAG